MKQVILGLDPGTLRTGFAVLALECDTIQLLNFGTITASPKNRLDLRLLSIGQSLEKLYQQCSPKETAIEKIFFGKNADSAFKLGQLFGLCLYQSVLYNSAIFQYAARFIKKSVTGSGSADKYAVQSFVCNVLNIQDQSSSIGVDATDAIAVALCHIYQKQRNSSLARPIHSG